MLRHKPCYNQLIGSYSERTLIPLDILNAAHQCACDILSLTLDPPRPEDYIHLRRALSEAEDLINGLDEGTMTDRSETITLDLFFTLCDEINAILADHGLIFCSHEGDGACLGVWDTEEEGAQ